MSPVKYCILKIGGNRNSNIVFFVNFFLSPYCRWSHVSDHPVRCSQCNESFTSHSAFEHHMKSHANYKFECHECGKTFAKESYMIRHQMRMHGVGKKEIVIAEDEPSYLPLSVSLVDWKKSGHKKQIVSWRIMEFIWKCLFCFTGQSFLIFAFCIWNAVQELVFFLVMYIVFLE